MWTFQTASIWDANFSRICRWWAYSWILIQTRNDLETIRKSIRRCFAFSWKVFVNTGKIEVRLTLHWFSGICWIVQNDQKSPIGERSVVVKFTKPELVQFTSKRIINFMSIFTTKRETGITFGSFYQIWLLIIYTSQIPEHVKRSLHYCTRISKR